MTAVFYVDDINPDLGAARSRRVEIGDQVPAMSVHWGATAIACCVNTRKTRNKAC
jgi:hypothetical protein